MERSDVTLRAKRKRDAGVAEPGVEILGLGGPAGRDGRLDAAPDRPSDPPGERGLDGSVRRTAGRAGDDSGAVELVVGPGETAGRVIEPVVRVIADASARGAEQFCRVAVGGGADDRLSRQTTRRPRPR